MVERNPGEGASEPQISTLKRYCFDVAKALLRCKNDTSYKKCSILESYASEIATRWAQ